MTKKMIKIKKEKEDKKIWIKKKKNLLQIYWEA